MGSYLQIMVLQAFFSVLSFSIAGTFVRSITELAETLVAFKRLESFLLLDEHVETAIENSESPEDEKSQNKNAIVLTSLSVKWNPTASEDVLHDFNLIIPSKQIVGIIGPVGSGKSALLETILGELEITSGTIKKNGHISYASQQPWIFAASIRQNILFGQPYDKYHYDNVTRVCALKKDFQQFPNGDMTMVGDHGASLSGGQKSRINLARAVYRKADIYLFDDPLSAVDANVGTHLFEQCINEFLGNKTRILVTHQLQHMKDADHLVVLRGVRIIL